MSDTQLIALKLDIKHHLDEMKVLCGELVSLLSELDDIPLRLTAIEKNREGQWCKLTSSEAVNQLTIFNKLTYSVNQDPKESVKFPSVIQLNVSNHSHILAVAKKINEHKDALANANKQLKLLLKKRSAEVWQDIMCYSSIVQILRHVSLIEQSVSYLGLSYMTKPVVKSMTKSDALDYVDNKINYYISKSNFLSQIPFLDELRKQIDAVNENNFEIKLARKGAPRYMLNAVASDSRHQIMASMPVLVFSKEIIQVSLPKGIKRKTRSDKRIPLGEVKSDFGLYLIPRSTTHM
jgi:hypothetical protein